MITYCYRIECSDYSIMFEVCSKYRDAWRLTVPFVRKVEDAHLFQNAFRRLLSSSKSSDKEWMARQYPDVRRMAMASGSIPIQIKIELRFYS
jgi:hypothetical protein